MTTKQQRSIGLTALLLLALGFFAAVVASNALLRGLRIDLTENRLYTISPGTHRVLESIAEPINLYFFFSDSETSDVPDIQGLRTYATRVREMLEEFVAQSDGMLVLQVVDPLPFSEEEDRATQFGIQPLALGQLGESIFFGLAGTNSVGGEQTIGFFQPDKEAFLEYELARLVYSLANPEKPVVGLLSGVSMAAGFDPQLQRMTEPWVITTQARQLFEIRNLTPGQAQIDSEVDILWIVHPQDLDDATLYAIDQFILGGGRALIFVDPLAEIDMVAADPTGMAMGSASNLERLFDTWGIAFSADEIVADDRLALSVSGGPGGRPIRHLGLLGLDAETIDREEVVTAGLGSINVGTAGYFTRRDDASVELVPLLWSSTQAAALPASRFQFLADPTSLLDDFVPSGETYVLAARLDGPLTTAFPDGAPEGAGETAATPLTSTDSANVIVVGDVDVLSDRLWVQVQRFLGQQIVTPFANNGDLVVNALDNLSGSADLIGIRARATFSRPFTTVEELRREADAQFRQTEQQLEAELDETERRLGELQEARTDQGSLLMSEEQQAEIQRFLGEQVRIRSELRAVRRNLDSSIERLGTMVKIINIGLVPLLLSVAAVGVAIIRRRRLGAGP
ncbi:MAG TPA: Gldg family protein [Gammaproteobacteria bacterium]|nr:Gldg family protein [Gammaproteobacteria bacterium]